MVWSPGQPWCVARLPAWTGNGKRCRVPSLLHPAKQPSVPTAWRRAAEAIGRRWGLLPVPTRYRMTWTWPQKVGWVTANYFTSSDPHPDILFWHSFRHSIWHIFWHSICIWHSIWHLFWHSFCRSFWHYIWHVFKSRRAPQHPELAEEDGRRRRRRSCIFVKI